MRRPIDVASLSATCGRAHLDLVATDLSSHGLAPQAAAEIRRRFEHIDIHVGIAAAPYSRRTLSEDGIELQMAAQHLGPFLPTRLLLDSLLAAEAGRITDAISRGRHRARFGSDDLNEENNYFALSAYARSKPPSVLFACEPARRLAATRVTVNCLRPGRVPTRTGNGHASRIQCNRQNAIG